MALAQPAADFLRQQRCASARARSCSALQCSGLCRAIIPTCMPDLQQWPCCVRSNKHRYCTRTWDANFGRDSQEDAPHAMISCMFTGVRRSAKPAASSVYSSMPRTRQLWVRFSTQLLYGMEAARIKITTTAVVRSQAAAARAAFVCDTLEVSTAARCQSVWRRSRSRY